MDIIEFRENLIGNVCDYSLTELKNKFDKAEREFLQIEKLYNQNEELYLNSLFSAGVIVGSYRKAIKLKEEIISKNKPYDIIVDKEQYKFDI